MMRTVLSLALILLFAGLLLADIAPDPGYTRVQVSIVLETADDTPDYRFFLVSGDQVREIFVKKGEKTTVGAVGGGARYSSGSVYAVTKKALSVPEPGVDAVEHAPGAIKLVSHSFTRTVRDAEARDISDAVYRLEKTSGGLNAVPVSAGSKVKANSNSNANAGHLSFSVVDQSRSLSLFGWTTIVAGLLLCAAAITFGFRVFTKVLKKGAR